MRELRVEDALLYLDQVKVEFGDRPHIYNEFLEIMKTFKTQQIDTPGVIRRVSNLFQGNRRLVLGFNTFLPEGYQIELPPDGDGPPVAVYRAPGSNIAQILQESTESQAHSVGRGNPPMGQQQPVPPHAAQQPQMRNQPAHGHPMRGPQMAPHEQPYGQPMQQHGQAPPPQSMMPPHDGQQLMAARPAHHTMEHPQQPQQPPHPGTVHRPLPPPAHQQHPHEGPRPPHMQPPLHMNGQAAARPPPPPRGPPFDPMAQGTSPPQQQQPPPQQAQPPMEFDHAINYVTTIKKRFSNQPETYKKFLEILHTYQKEQRGIKEVLEEVSDLFGEHPDLLKEFTYFLPDGVQATAKAQLEQAAKEAEARKRAKQQQQQQQQQQPQATPRGEYLAPPPKTPYNDLHGRSEEQEMQIIRSARHGVVSFSPVRPPRRNEPTPAQVAAKKGRPTAIPELPITPSATEASFFQKVKDHLERRELQSERLMGSRRHTPYAEFLKCLHLFGAGVVNRDELLQLLRTLFSMGHAPKVSSSTKEMIAISHTALDLLSEFEELMLGRGPYAAQEAALKEKSKYGSMQVRELELSKSDTPSYYTYPSDYPSSLFLNHPGQTQADWDLLNDTVVCVGADYKDSAPSIEDYNGVRMRHNAYEEMMFRIEDERFELDMAIERNAHALRQIEPLAEEVQTLRDQEEKDSQPIGRLQYSLNRYALNSIQTNAIARIYGEKGDEILQHLVRNPLAVLPIVYQRLKQKDTEWRSLQADLTAKWKQAEIENYEGSLDVLCYFKRRAVERRATPSRLRDDCIHAGTYCRHPERLQSDEEASKPFQPTFGLEHEDRGALLYQPYVKVSCPAGESCHKDVFDLVSMYMSANMDMSALDKERVGRIWAEFVAPWFGYPAHWITSEVRDSFSGKITPNIVTFSPGQRVCTIYGEGTIASPIDQNGSAKYSVKLPFGIAHLDPSAVLYAIPGGVPYVRREGIMVRDETVKDANGATPCLDGNRQLLFATESIFLFLRLYAYLLSVLVDTREYCQNHDIPVDPTLAYYSPGSTSNASDGEKPQIDFASAIASLKQVMSKKMNRRTYEALGRKLSKEKVHQLAALPKLVERCAGYLLKSAKEDVVLSLYDYCSQPSADPVLVREQCFSVAPDASYRIQYHGSAGELLFSHVPKGQVLLTAPNDEIKSFSEEEEGGHFSPMEEEDDDPIEDFDDENGGQPLAKRQKLK